LKFIDQKGQVIIEEVWESRNDDLKKEGTWTKLVKIPEGEEIIGMKWNTNEKWICKLSFSLWMPNTPNGT